MEERRDAEAQAHEDLLRLLYLLGLALRASVRMHVASLAGMLLFLFLLGSDWGAFWALVLAVAFNTCFVFVEGLLWAARMEREMARALVLSIEEEKTPIVIVPVKHTWMN